MNSLDTPDDLVKDLFAVYNKSPVDKVIREAQARGEVIDGDPYTIHTLFWLNLHTTICYCFNYKLEYPPTEWFLQVIRKR